MSTQLSADGMYYWDGQHWRSTLSPDGRFRWIGTAWAPVPGPTYAALPPRQATSWTRPLQLMVGGWYAISALWAASFPLWMSNQMSQILSATIQRQQQQNPYATPLPSTFYDTMNSLMTDVLWVTTIISVAIALLVVVGALQRWVWLYYVVLVFLGLGAVSGPLNLLNMATRYSAYGYTPPSWLVAFGGVSWLLSTALFVLMLVALVKRGPWGMTRPAAS